MAMKNCCSFRISQIQKSQSTVGRIVIIISLFFLTPKQVEGQIIKNFFQEFLILVDPDARKIKKLIKKVKRLERKKPEESDIELVKSLWEDVNKIEPRKWKEYPKSYFLTKSIIFDKWYALEHRYEINSPLVIEGFCFESTKNWKEMLASNKEIGDIYLLAKYEKTFGFESESINPWADSIVNARASECTLSGGCPAPFCGNGYNAHTKRLISFYKEAIELTDVQSTKLDSIQVDRLWKKFLAEERKGFFGGGEAPLIYAITKGLLNDARYYFETGASSKAEKQKNINSTGCIAKVAWGDALKRSNEMCEEEVEIARCIIREYTPHIQDNSIHEWISNKYKSAYYSCRRDTCLNALAVNSAMHLSDKYGHDDALCTFCTCVDTMYHEGYNATTKYAPEQLIPNQDSCKTLRVGCIDECSASYCETCTVNDVEQCTESLCGCLDSTAVNFAHDSIFNKGHSIYAQFYNLRVNTHNQSLCTWKACMDTCSVSFHPRAKESDECVTICGCTNIEASNYNPNASHEDSTCVFVKELALDSIKTNLLDFLEEEGMSQGAIFLINNYLNLTNCGLDENCLSLSLDIDGNVVELASNMAGFETGSYRDTVVQETIKALIKYFNYGMFSDYFKKSGLNVYIVGESDKQKIRFQGIPYLGDFGVIRGGYNPIHKKEPQTGDENIYALKIERAKRTVLLPIDGKIKSNLLLAYVRAYTIELPIRQYRKDANIAVGAKKNNQVGPEHRKVYFKMEFQDFFKLMELGGISESDSEAEINYKTKYLSETKCSCNQS